MENTIILASHGSLAKGMKDTIDMIIGKNNRIYSLSLLREDSSSIKDQVKFLMKTINKKENIYILTDILGGSVNNEMLELLMEYPYIHVIAGMNLSLVISIATYSGNLDEKKLNDIIYDCRNSMVNCNELLNETYLEEGEDL